MVRQEEGPRNRVRHPGGAARRHLLLVGAADPLRQVHLADCGAGAGSHDGRFSGTGLLAGRDQPAFSTGRER